MVAEAKVPAMLQLQYSKRAVSTEDLTKSFGWDSTGSHMQEDVHEFNKILCEGCQPCSPINKHTFYPFSFGHQLSFTIWSCICLLSFYELG